jgi:pimeloyl-ACP methyl ester carboxylesterase
MWCQVEHVRFHYQAYGEGMPVVLIHGWGYDHHLMAGCMEPIFEKRAGYMRIYPDLPGMGYTKGSPGLKNADQFLDSIIQFIEKVAPGQHFLVAGQSFGGYLARGIAYKLSERLEGVFLLCPVVIPDRQLRDLPPYQLMKEDKSLESTLKPEELKEYLSQIIVQNPRTLERFRSDMEPGIRLYDAAFADPLQKCCYGYSFDIDEPSKHFNRPSLILTARQDTQVGYRDALWIIDNYPRGTFAVIDEAGHGLPIEKEDIFNCMVNEWLDRVEESLRKSHYT